MTVNMDCEHREFRTVDNGEKRIFVSSRTFDRWITNNYSYDESMGIIEKLPVVYRI